MRDQPKAITLLCSRSSPGCTRATALGARLLDSDSKQMLDVVGIRIDIKPSGFVEACVTRQKRVLGAYTTYEEVYALDSLFFHGWLTEPLLAVLQHEEAAREGTQ